LEIDEKVMMDPFATLCFDAEIRRVSDEMGTELDMSSFPIYGKHYLVTTSPPPYSAKALIDISDKESSRCPAGGKPSCASR
jgi:hypothetical protein